MKCRTDGCTNVLGPLARKRHTQCPICRKRLSYWEDKSAGEILQRRDNLRKYTATIEVAVSSKRRAPKKKIQTRRAQVESRAQA